MHLFKFEGCCGIDSSVCAGRDSDDRSWQGARVQAQQARGRTLCTSITAVQACWETEREDITEFLHQAEDARRKFSPSFVDFIHDEQLGG